MSERFSSNLGTGPRFSSWPMALIGIVLIKAVLSLAVKPGTFLLSYSGISYFLLLLLATGFVIQNGIQNTLRSRPFWVFLAIAYGLWALDQWFFLYYELALHTEVPDNSIADPVLFFHIAPLMAAVATLPHRNGSDRKLYPAISNSLLLLFFWGFLYVYAVFPYQYLFPNATSYPLRFDTFYLLENTALVLAVGVLSLRVQGPWKVIYLHLLGACGLYALSSAVANIAIDSGGYVNGKLYGLGLTGSVCWFVWIPLRARQLMGNEVTATRSDSHRGSQASAWAMLVVVMISIPIVWELFQRDEPTGMRTFRLLVAIAAIVCLASAAYIKEYLAKSELASHLGLANDRLRLAVEAGKSVGWEWDMKTGRNSWFGDLESMFGIPSDTFAGQIEDFYRYVHPEDRQLVTKTVADARQSRKPYAAEFRVVRLDGTVRWVTAAGRFYYGTNGDAERMLGMAADVTDRKQVEQALRHSEEELKEAQRLTKVGSWQWDPSTNIASWSEELYRIAGRDPHLPALNCQEQPQLYTPETWERLQHAVQEALRTGTPFELDLELVRPDGTTRSVVARGEAQRDTLGRIVQLRGTGQDITERKRAEVALASVSRKLIEAQEQERTRIARELHDDVVQRLALLTVELEQLRQDPCDLSTEARSRIGELSKQTSELTTDVQYLSHELHSSKLEYLGIAAAMRGFCQEFGEQQKVEIDFIIQDLPNPLSSDISLCLFRVLQEALHNSAKHSGVRHFEVRLWGTSGEIHLAVKDSGAGFDSKVAKRGRGLGLISMEERVKILKGTLSIESQPKRGTRIHIRVPLSSGSDAMRAAG